MRCRQFRKKYRKYLYGQLPESEYVRIIKHIPDCPDCAAEANSLKKMRSLLQFAGKADRPDAYWNTYWERLEKKLPEKPMELTLKSRISDAAKGLFHRPLLLGQIAVYILLLAFIIYTVPNRLFREPPNIASKSSTALNKPESTITAGREQASVTAPRGIKKVVPQIPAAHSVVKEKPKLGVVASKPIEAKEQPAEVELAMKVAEPAKPAMSVMYDKLASAAQAEDQYAIAEQHFKNGEYAQAIPEYQNFVTANSTDPRVLNAQYQIGESYYQMKKYPEAISNFVVITDAEKAGAVEARGVVQQKNEIDSSKDASSQYAYRARRTEAALKEAPALKQTTEDRKDATENREKLMSRAIYRQAESYEKLEKNQEALEKYQEYVQKYPEGEYVAKAKEKIDKLSK